VGSNAHLWEKSEERYYGTADGEEWGNLQEVKGGGNRKSLGRDRRWWKEDPSVMGRRMQRNNIG